MVGHVSRHWPLMVAQHRNVNVRLGGVGHFVPNPLTSAKVNRVTMAVYVNRGRDGFDAFVHKDFPDLIAGLTLTNVLRSHV